MAWDFQLDSVGGRLMGAAPPLKAPSYAPDSTPAPDPTPAPPEPDYGPPAPPQPDYGPPAPPPYYLAAPDQPSLPPPDPMAQLDQIAQGPTDFRPLSMLPPSVTEQEAPSVSYTPLSTIGTGFLDAPNALYGGLNAGVDIAGQYGGEAGRYAFENIGTNPIGAGMGGMGGGDVGGAPTAQQSQQMGDVGQFVGAQAPIAAAYAAAPEVGLPTAAIDAYFGARGLQQANQTVQDYRAGNIDAMTALEHLAMVAPQLAIPALHGAGALRNAGALDALDSIAKSPRVQAARETLGSERGSLDLPGEKPIPPDGELSSTPPMPGEKPIPPDGELSSTPPMPGEKPIPPDGELSSTPPMPGEGNTPGMPERSSPPGAGEAAGGMPASAADNLPPPAETTPPEAAPPSSLTASGGEPPTMNSAQLGALWDEYRKQFGDQAEQKMIDAGLIKPAPPFAEIAPPVAPGATARAGADELGLGKPADALPANQQGLQTVHTSGGEMSADKGSLAYRIDAKPTTIDEVALSVTDALRKAEKLRPAQQEMFAAQRGAQAAKVEAAFKNSPPDEAFMRAKAAAAGGFDRPTFTPLDLPPEHLQAIQSEIADSPALKPFERLNASTALEALQNGKLPQPGHAATLGKLLGPDFVETVSQLPVTHSWKEEFQAALGAFPTLLTSFTAHGPFNQRWKLFPSHPLMWLENTKQDLQALAGSAEARRAWDSDIRNSPVAIGIEGKPYIPLLSEATHQHNVFGHDEFGQATEQFYGANTNTYIGKFINSIPGVARSKEAFTLSQNGMRASLYTKFVSDGINLGITDPKWFMEMGTLADRATGWGKVGNPEIAGMSAMFSPRNWASKFQWPAQMFTNNPQVRGEAFKQFVAYAGMTGTALAALKMTGANVNVDPFSAQFGQLQDPSGNTRINLLRDYAPLVRLVSQVGMNRRDLQTSNGQTVATDRDLWDGLKNYATALESPSLQLTTTMLMGKNAAGQKVSRTDPAGVGKEFGNAITPIFGHELFNAAQEGTPFAIGSLPFSFGGASVGTYGDSPSNMKTADKIAGKNLLGDLHKQGLPDENLAFKEWQPEIIKELGPDAAKASTMTELRKAYIAAIAPQLMQRDGSSQAVAQAEASQAFDQFGIIKQFNQEKSRAKQAYWLQHPDKLRQAIDAGIEPATAANRKILTTAGAP